MSLLIKDKELLEKYNEIWEKVSSSIKKEFESNPLYNEKYLKTKIKVYNKKSIQIPTVIKCRGKVQNVFAYQYFYLILFIKNKIIFRCF